MAKVPIAIWLVTASPNPPGLNFDNRAIGRGEASWPGATSLAAGNGPIADAFDIVGVPRAARLG